MTERRKTIRIQPSQAAIRVVANGEVIAESAQALVLVEDGYSPVHYLPREDVDMVRMHQSTRATYCPHKGTARYFHIELGGGRIEDAVWTYEQPVPQVATIAGRLAFRSDKLEVLEVRA